MGVYLNPGNDLFEEAVRAEIYVDKTELISCTNKYIRTPQKFVCVSRPRRFGKSMAAYMLAAYYGKGCDSSELFAPYKIAGDKQYNTDDQKKYLDFIRYQIDFDTMKSWYDGYAFPEVPHIYNPKSVVDSIRRKRFASYWTQTETYEALKIHIVHSENTSILIYLEE